MTKPPEITGDHEQVRVLATRRPPYAPVSTEALSAADPYLTDVWLAHQLGLDGDASGAEGDRNLNGLGEYILAQPPTPALTLLYAISLSEVGEELFRGAYPATERNPVYALNAFVAFHALGLYPPNWVLNWLNDAFNSHLQSGGAQSLETLLGVKRGKGQAPIFQEMAAVDAETNMMHEMLVLNAAGVAIADAAAMVAGRLETEGVKCPSPETLAERFSKRSWGASARLLKASSDALTAAQSEEAFAGYPEHTRPNHRK